jgi:hypothetical protein
MNYISTPLQQFANLSDEQRAQLPAAEKKRMVAELRANLASGSLGTAGNPFQVHCIKMLSALETGSKPPKRETVWL